MVSAHEITLAATANRPDLKRYKWLETYKKDLPRLRERSCYTCSWASLICQ